jgi:hypothetical protein
MKPLQQTYLILLASIAMMFQNLSSNAQQHTGSLNIYQDQRIDSLLALNIEYNKAFPFISGYRIQIYMGLGNDALDNANMVRSDFEKNFPGVLVYVTFREPYYRVRIGDFRSRLEANQLLESIKRIYPDAWIIQDNINLPLLPNYQKTDSYE